MGHQADATVAASDQLTLGRALAALRHKAEMTQEQVANELGADATLVSRIERGKRGIRWPTLIRFLRVLDADLHQLADEIDKQK